jgi:toxin FitB
MIVLDTNVLSVLMYPKRPAAVMAWFKMQSPQGIWTTAITIFEASAGIEQVDNAGQRQALRTAFDSALEKVVKGRILSFDTAAAQESALLFAARKRQGRIVELRDTQIAGIIRARKATLATRNIRDFADAGIPLVDPWTGNAD